MMGSVEIRNKAAEKEMKTVNLVARPTFTSPSSTPVTIATLMMKSPWRSVEDPQLVLERHTTADLRLNRAQWFLQGFFPNNFPI